MNRSQPADGIARIDAAQERSRVHAQIEQVLVQRGWLPTAAAAGSAP